MQIEILKKDDAEAHIPALLPTVSLTRQAEEDDADNIKYINCKFDLLMNLFNTVIHLNLLIASFKTINYLEKSIFNIKIEYET